MKTLFFLALLFVASLAQAQGDVPGLSGRPTYAAVGYSFGTTTDFTFSLEGSATRGYKIARVCVTTSTATAAGVATVEVRRRTTASSGGTAATAEATGNPAINRMDPSSAAWPGVFRQNGTPGTAGAVLDAWNFQVGTIATEDFDVLSCKSYGTQGEQMPTIPAGVANGATVSVTAAGAGGLAGGSISITVIQE